MRLSEPTKKIWMKIDPYYRQQKCRPMTLDSGEWRYKFYADIRGGSLRRGVKRRWGCRQRQFSAFSRDISSETLEIRPALLYSDTPRPSSAFHWSQNVWSSMTLSGYFALNSVFAPVWLSQTARLWKNNCVKTNKDRQTYTVSGANLWQRLYFLAI